MENNITIEDLDLSTRAYQFCILYNISHLEEFTKHSKDEVATWRNANRKTVQEIEEALINHGLNWAD